MYSAGLHSFIVRRALHRTERGEITPLEAAEIIRQSSNTATRSKTCYSRDLFKG